MSPGAQFVTPIPHPRATAENYISTRLINLPQQIYQINNNCIYTTSLPSTSNLTSNMHLHLRKLLGHSHPHSHGHRTDLSCSYPMSPKERAAQGYCCRSDWAWDIGLLLQSIQRADEEAQLRTGTIDWEEWSVQYECSKVCRYHFEDLDEVDQVRCVVFWRALSEREDFVCHLTRPNQLAPIEEVIAHLLRFKQQAEQLYGVYPDTEMNLKRVLGGEVYMQEPVSPEDAEWA